MGRLVALALAGGPDYATAIRRVWDAGDAIAPLDPRLPPAEARRVLDVLRPTAVIEADGEPRALPGGVPVVDGDALVIATSGTSGTPKAVIHTHDSVTASAVATSKALDVDPTSDRWLACLPLAHIGGLSVVLRSLVTGTAVEIHDGFDPGAVEEAVQRGATLVSLVTRALNQIDPGWFRAILLGGGPPPEAPPANAITTYGMTETGSGVVYDTELLEGMELSIGPPGAGPEPGTGEPPTDRVGEIHLRGPLLFRGYRDQPDPFIDGGWFPTGDLGSIGPGGELRVAGRRGDLIITGGENVWPEPVERLLAARPDIAQVAVIGRPDPEWGRRVTAVVVPAPGHPPPSVESLRETVRGALPAWAAPRAVEVARDLPRTSLGKLQRNRL